MRASSWLSNGAVLLLCLGACDSVTEVGPAEPGQRGENCQARNDCEVGLACISGVCSKNDFPITVSAKQCDQIDCEDTEDCCGDRPTEAPSECANRARVCDTSTIPECVRSTCESDSECEGGTCGSGACSNTFFTCDTDAECTDTCVSGQCLNTFLSCVSDVDCDGTCMGKICDCTNPDYDPFDPICTDPDCDDVCVFKCESERCVVDDACTDDVDCPFTAPMCDDGSCVECMEDADCDEDASETCLDGRCDVPCKDNEECPLFHACKDGECVERGCGSDKECVLAGGSGGEDARLSMCLPSDADPDVKICKVPCENDGACSQFQVCEAGFCKFVGCDNDEECRAFLGLENQEVTDARPFVSKAICRE